ncbi:MAG TPA: hypothetical protein VMV15_12115 [Candidatus Binataceae bacterium]|nr:hypothetical protein [Candidatus Binataceae bacterium]
MVENRWDSHDFKVKMLDWSAARGSRLAHTCRRCGRGFSRFTVLSHGVWAIDGEGRALESTVSNQWLSEACPRASTENDDEDRKRLRDVVAQ